MDAPKAVVTTTRVPAWMWGGTITRWPLERIAGLKEEDAVCPLTTGSASTTSNTTRGGSSTDTGRPSWVLIFTAMFSCR